MTIDNETIGRLLHHTDGALKVYLWVALNDGKSVGQRELAKELNLTHQNVRSAIKWLVDKKMVSVLGNTPPNTPPNTEGNTPKTLLSICKPYLSEVEKNKGNTPPNTPPNTEGNTPKEENRKEENFLPLTPPIKEENKKEEKPTIKSACARKKNPTLEEVRAYFEKKGITDIDAEVFWNFYEANGWVQGTRNKPIKDWTRCVVTWRRMPYYRPQGMNVGVVIQGSGNPNRFDDDETW